jgi:hypothetical protein
MEAGETRCGEAAACWKWQTTTFGTSCRRRRGRFGDTDGAGWRCCQHRDSAASALEHSTLEVVVARAPQRLPAGEVEEGEMGGVWRGRKGHGHVAHRRGRKAAMASWQRRRYRSGPLTAGERRRRLRRPTGVARRCSAPALATNCGALQAPVRQGWRGGSWTERMGRLSTSS